MTIGFSPKQRAANRKCAPFYYPGSAATDATESWCVFRAPSAGKVTVSFIPQSAVTGADTNSANLNVVNKGTSGLGATELGNVDFVAGTNASAFDEVVICFEKTVGDDHVIAVEREKVGTGLALPEGVFNVEFVPDGW